MTAGDKSVMDTFDVAQNGHSYILPVQEQRMTDVIRCSLADGNCAAIC